jgi:hypothetical protein
MVEDAVGPWWPGRLHVDGQRLETEPLATWWTRFDQHISDWKSERVYVDARDVTPANFDHHPAKRLGPEFPRLSALLEITPVFALGDADRRPATIPGARVYRVGFERRADDTFWVSAHGPRMNREFSAPFLNLEKALGQRASRDREWLIDRVLDAMTKGRLTRRSLDLAEMWSALCGGPSMFHFEEDERLEYLQVLEASFEEALDRVEAGSERESYESIVELLNGDADVVELPRLGRATRHRAPRVTISATVQPKSRALGIVIDVDGKSKLTLRERVRHQLLRPLPGFEAQAYRAWRAKDGERMTRTLARVEAERRKAQRAAMRPLVITCLLLLALIGGPCGYMLSRSSPGDPCQKDSDCRGVCRETASGTGVCTTLCNAGRCGEGRTCKVDAKRGQQLCIPNEEGPAR